MNILQNILILGFDDQSLYNLANEEGFGLTFLSLNSNITQHLSVIEKSYVRTSVLVLCDTSFIKPKIFDQVR